MILSVTIFVYSEERITIFIITVSKVATMIKNIITITLIKIWQ